MKKLLAIALVLIMTASVLAVGVSAAAGDVDQWDGTADTSWYDPTKTQFTITTAEQLAGMAELTGMGVTFDGVEFKLAADIQINTGDAKNWDLVAPANTWKPIGSNNASFAGSFDGQGHTVSGIYTPIPEVGDKDTANNYKALFGSVGDTSGNNEVIIKNLNLTNSRVGAYQYASVLAARVVGITKIEDIRVTNSYLYAVGDLTFEKKSPSNVDTGCVVGFLNGVTELTVSRCSAIDCDLFGWVRVGSIIGGGSGTYLEVNDCYSNSTVNGENRPGGIIGHSSVSLVVVNNCMFEGDIICPATDNYGGIIGGFRADASASIEAHNCYYAGTYTFRGETVHARFGSTEIGVLDESSEYYSGDPDDISDQPTQKGNDADGAEVLPKIKGAGAFAAFSEGLDKNVWDVSATSATLKPVSVNEVPFAQTTPETTAAPETSAAPTETTKAPTNDTTKAPAGNDTTKAPTNDTTKAPAGNDTTNAPAETTDNNNGGGLGTGAIIGIVAACVAVVAVIVAIVLGKKKKA